MRPSTIGRVAIRPALSALLVALAMTPPAHADDDPAAGYRLDDDRATVRLLATIPGESVAQVVVDPAGRLFLGGREAVFVVDPADVKPGLKPREIYREKGDHWFMGLATRGDDLYVAKHNAILALPGAARGKPAAEARPIVWGFAKAKGWAFHQTLHDLKLGPDGKLYFSMGDPAWFYGDFRWPDHWFRTRIETAGTPARRDIVSIGGIFRCDPADGSNLQLVATGTRNNVGFDWNESFDLFTTDNDHEQDNRYVPGRLLYIVPGGFYNWPRGWMDDRPEDLPALAGMGREVPVGLAVYGDTRLPADYKGNVLVARWGRQRIDRYALTREGAGYTAKEVPWLACPPGRRPMAVAVGRGGRVYAVVGHMETNAESPTYAADLLEIDAKDAHEGFEGYEPADAPDDRLWAELGHADLSRRVAAHNELARRGGATLDSIADRIRDSKYNALSIYHLVRLAGVAPGAGSAADALTGLLGRAERGVREEATIVLSALSRRLDGEGKPLEVRVGRDMAPRATLAFLSDILMSDDVMVGGAALDEGRSDDPFLRQVATRLMARNRGSADRPADGKAVAGAAPKGDKSARLASVLADGFYLTIPPADEPLPGRLKLEPSPYEDPPADRDRRLGVFSIDAWWKALDKKPSHEAAFARLVEALDDPEAEIRLQALRSLARLADARVVPSLEPIIDRPKATDAATLSLALLTLARLGGVKEAERIARVLATTEGPALRAAAEALVALDPGGERAPAAVSEALAKLATMEGLGDQTRQAAIRRLAAPEMLKAMVFDPQTAPPFRAAALERLAGIADAATLEGVLAQIPKDAGPRLLNPAARLAATRLSSASAMRLLGGWLEAPSEDARRAAAQAIGAARKPEYFALARARLAAESSPGTARLLAESVLADKDGGADRDAALANFVRSRSDLDPGLVGRVVGHLKSRAGYERIASEVGSSGTPSGLPAAFAAIDWAKDWKGGDPERGRALFRSQTGVSCIVCHRFRGEGGQNGPSLEEADKRLTVAYVVESVLKPNAQVAPQYRPWTLALKSGEVLNGVLLEQGAEALTIGFNDGTTRRIAPGDVEERQPSSSSIMPEGLVAKPEDLRDLLAYLLTPARH